MKRTLVIAALLSLGAARTEDRPHIVLVMTDDQGWGQTGYAGHPILKTPHLDAMAANGLRFDRFYAGGPVCSPTRATVLTGRTHNRSGVFTHGRALRLQEKTLARALKDAGYATGHFGKWHLNGVRGPGVPVLKDDPHGPGAFGFDTWLSVTNFFERDCLLSRNGAFEAFEGDSSEIIVDEALAFIDANRASKPTFSVIWYGTPHSPWVASEEDRAPFAKLGDREQHHYGELVAMDRSIGALRAGLRGQGIADNTLVWFCSDNGGLSPFGPATVGGLRGFKGSVYEGGIRVPGIVEWPAGIPKPRLTNHPAATMDIFPTIADLLGLPETVMLKPIDGVSLKPLFAGEIGPRKKPLGFRFTKAAALIDNDLKIVMASKGKYALYHLVDDPKESKDLMATSPEAARMKEALDAWVASVEASVEGRDYPGGRLAGPDIGGRFWMDMKEYAPHLETFAGRPEYAGRLNNKKKKSKKK